MPIFSFSEADRKRWAAQGALAVQAAAERTRASMADNLEAFGEDSFPDVPGEVFDQQEWLDEMEGEIADYFDEIAAEAAYAFADGAEIDPTDGEDGGPGFFTSAAILAMTGLIGYEIAQMLSNRGEIVADRVETLMGRGSEDGWDSTRLGDELGLGEDTSGPLSDALAEAMGESSATSISEGAAHGMIELGQMVGTKTWNCVAPDTLVAGVGVTAVSRKWFAGEMVRISTRSGAVLSVTPEHRVLVRDVGWVRADALVEGNELVRSRPAEWSPSSDPHISNGVRIEEMFEASVVVSPPDRVPAVSVNFDGKRSHEEVDVVRPARFLVDRLEASFLQQACEDLLVLCDAGLACLFADSYRSSVRQLVGGAFPDQELAFVQPSEMDVRGPEARPNSSASHANLGPDSPARHSALVHRDQHVSRNIVGASEDSKAIRRSGLLQSIRPSEPDPGGSLAVAQRPVLRDPASDCLSTHPEVKSYLGGAFSALVSTDDVVLVERYEYEGNVYDLSTERGWFLADAGVIVHNCMFRNSRDSHMDADGQTVAVDELFVLAGGEGMYPGDPELPPEESINCVLPDTVLSADEISRAYRRSYSGPVVRLSTRAGHDLTVTPNHPVLTGRGWVPAGEVQPSVDHLYRLVDEAVITGVDPHIQGDPASEVFVAARDAGVVHRVAGSSVDFHGDGRVTDVEVVSTDRLLRTSDVAALSKSLQEFMLVGADELEGALAGPGFGRQLVGPGLAPASGGVGGNDRRGVSFLSGSLGFAPSSEFSPGLGEPMVDRPTGHVEISGEALDGLAGVVSADEVVSVEWGQWSGYVFNLGTASNWYGANGLIVHNCQCWVTYSIDSPDEGVVEGEASADEEGGALADITPGDSGDGTADAEALSVGRVPQKRGVGLYAAGDVALLRDGTDSVTLVNAKSASTVSNGGRWAVREFGGPGSGPHKLTDAEKADRAERKGVIDEQKSLKGTTGKEGRPRDEAKIAEVRGTKGSDTQKDFKDANGKYTPERQALHAQIIASFLEGVPKADGTPSVTFLGGGPAAGKSTVETSGRSGMPSTANREAVLVNADEIKNMLPEMDKLVEAGDRGAAGFVHEESSDISAMLLQAALDGGYHTVVDAVGDSSAEKMGAKIDAARASGAAVKGLYVTAPTDVAVARAEARGEKKGRFVGESIVRAGHASVSRIFPQIADKFDSVQLFDSGTGGEPKLLGEGTLGQPFTVHDDAGYGTFLAKGTA